MSIIHAYSRRTNSSNDGLTHQLPSLTEINLPQEKQKSMQKKDFLINSLYIALSLFGSVAVPSTRCVSFNMEGVFGKYLTSPLFTFQVGPEKKEVTVHSAPLAELSQSLNTLMNGEMIEAKTRRVDWSDVDADTFTRLCEYAYLRDYTPPSYRLFEDRPSIWSFVPNSRVSGKKKKKNLRKRSESVLDGAAAEPEPEPAAEYGYAVEPEPEPEPAAEYGYAVEPEPAPEPVLESEPAAEPAAEPAEEIILAPSVGAVLPYKERSVWTRHLRDKFRGGFLFLESQNQSRGYTFTPLSNTGSEQDFTPVFVDQVRLYILADKYGIQPLCELVLHKLYQTLKSFKLYSTGVTGVVEFVRFVYSNAPPSFGDRKDPLRDLATRYIVSVLGQIGETREFQELLEEGGAFVTDFWQIVWSF